MDVAKISGAQDHPLDEVPADVTGPIIWGAAIGLSGAFGLGVLRLANADGPERSAELAGTVVLFLLLSTPAAIAFAALRAGGLPRGPLLLGAVVSSLLSLGISFAGLGIIFLVPAVLFGIGAFHCFRVSGWKRGIVTVFALGALGASALFAHSFVLLFSGPGEARCWETIRYEDGRVESRTYEVPSGNTMSGGSSNRPGVISESGGCTSDIITAAEAVKSLTAWGFGAMLIATIWATGSWMKQDVMRVET